MTQHAATSSRAPVLWGIVVGLLQAATPLAIWWLDSATVYALGLAVIAFAFVVVARSHFVANTRWWPPFCMVVDFVVAAIIVVEIGAGMHFG